MASIVGHSEIKAFAEDRVNLPAQTANKHRAQVSALRKRLEKKIAEDSSFDLVKMLHSGSVAKGTALRTVNDLDVAVYVKAGSAPAEDAALQPWLAARLREANTNMDPSQFVAHDHCVTVSFRGSELDVDVAPVLYEGADNDCGYLVRKNTGQRVMTSIPLHLTFIRARKATFGDDFKQLIRLIKWWKRTELSNNADFRFKSFMIELLWAHLADSGITLNDYPEALRQFFSYIVTSELKRRITFADFTTPSTTGTAGDAIQVIDPVNSENNVAQNYTVADRQRIIEAAGRALDAIGDAMWATTKSDAVDCWQEVLGPSFTG